MSPSSIHRLSDKQPVGCHSLSPSSIHRLSDRQPVGCHPIRPSSILHLSIAYLRDALSGVILIPALLLSALFLAFSSTAHAKALLRETSPEQNHLQAPPANELVFARGESGTVSAYLGLDGGAAQLIDPAAIRTARVAAFTTQELFVDASNAAVTQTEQGAVYGPGTVVITNVNRDAIGSVEYTQYSLSGIILPATNVVSVDIDGITATVTISGDGPGVFLHVYPAVNIPVVDLTQNDVRLRDSMGEMRLSELRANVMTFAERNSGANWARYAATESVNLENHIIVFGRSSGSAFQGSAGQMTLYVGAQPAIVAEASAAGTSASGTILIADFDVLEDSVSITVTATGLTATDLTLQHSPSVSSPSWLAVQGVTTTTNEDGTITLTAPRDASAKTGFWRIVSDSTVSTVVTVNGDLTVLGGILMQSPNGAKWRISVSDSGTLTVTGA